MRIGSFSLNSDNEVIVKVVREVLNLFKLEITQEQPEYKALQVQNEVLPTQPVSVRTEVRLWPPGDGEPVTELLEQQAQADEHEKAAIHRLVKLNLYYLLRKILQLPQAPWGILHGVRPTKIVHRFLQTGMSAEQVEARLAQDYDVSPQKSRLLTDLAVLQQPFLATHNAKLVSVYVGIPFCLTRCLYCSFPSHLLPKQEVLDRFMAVLHRDLTAAKAELVRYGLQVQSIYIGGGTPTSLPDEYFARMVDEVYRTFYDEQTIEFTVEAGRPDSISEAKIRTMADYHVSRVSVNPQTMQERTLQLIGRRHTPQDIVQMYHALKDAGIPSINMDLIIGLPGETTADVRDTMAQLAELAPDDITLHALALKRGSYLKENIANIALPSDEEAREMFAVAMDAIYSWGMRPYYLYRQGYQIGQLENVGCCRPGGESIYNIQIMEERQTVIGIGGSATSKVVNQKDYRLKSAFNAKELSVYLDRIDFYIEKRAALFREAYG